MPNKEEHNQDRPESIWGQLFFLMRLHHFPVGTKLPFTSLALGMFMAAQRAPVQSVSLHAIYVKAGIWWLFIFVRHCASCVWNDICDRDIDRLVERTKNRPLASGKTSLQVALWLLSGLLLLCVWLLKTAAGSTNLLLFGLAGLVTFDVPYPLMKRWIDLPQLCLGATIAWPIPIAWMSVTGGLYENGLYDEVTLVMLCVAFGCSTFILDTIYACQDSSDDVQVGVKSSAVYFGARLRTALSALAAVVVTSLFIAGLSNGQRYCYFLLSVGGVASTFAQQLYTTDFTNKQQCGKALTVFSNRINVFIWAGALGDCIVRSRF